VTFTKDADDLMLWHVNIKDISSASVLNDILQSLKVHERQKVMKFHFLEDRKRALLSILLQRKMICQRFEVEDFEYQISRTSEVF
jgi:phosphopantetheinyl transferase